jgi:hypothetical protein
VCGGGVLEPSLGEIPLKRCSGGDAIVSKIGCPLEAASLCRCFGSNNSGGGGEGRMATCMKAGGGCGILNHDALE